MKEELFNTALKAFIHYYKNHPDVYDENGHWCGNRTWEQPCSSLSRITWKYVYLCNINGQLAKYNRQNGRIII